jgi:hypothetical protein
MRVCVLVLVAGAATARVAEANSSVAPTTSCTVVPQVVDFGPLDVQGPPALRTVTLTNTGNTALNVGAPTLSGDASFALSAGGALRLGPGESETVTVTFTPATEASATASLGFPITASTVTVPLTGRGIDRHVQVIPPSFPDTYRNPGNMAPVRPVTIMNTGGANLAITSVTIEGDPIWQLVDADPVDIPGGTSYDLEVRFVPSMIGAAPDGTLTIATDDVAHPVVSIPLQGNGIARAVTMTPPVIDLGYAGVGMPIRMSERADAPLAIENHDASSFGVQVLTTDDPAFTITTLDGKPTENLALPFGTSVPLDVTFVATTPGDYHTTATLFLDQDPDAQATVLVQAQADFLEAHGGAGCNAGGDAGAGVVLIALVMVLRRKRLAVLLVPAVASADPARNLDVSIFDPTPSTTSAGFQLVTPAIGERGDAVVSALLTYARDPLVLTSPQGDDVAIANRTTLVLGGAYALSERLELGAHMPLFIQNGDVVDPTMAAGTPPIGGDARGNLTVHAKAALTPHLGALATYVLPTASDDRFAGTGGAEGRLVALSAFTVAPRVSVLFDFGAVLRGRTHFANITERSSVTWGAGAGYDVTRGVAVTCELYGELVPSGRTDAMGHASLVATTELLAGAHIALDPRLTLGLAIGRGVIDGPGSPAFRGVVTLAFSARTLWEPPATASRPEPGPDQSDRDGDGIPDARDQCPDDPEDKDGFEDDDGCPDPDNDHDGVPDGTDACPNVPGDGADGCPEGDRDHDGIPDGRDACPTEPETINGIDDDDGCPDTGDPQVTIQPDHLELLAPITFTGAAIASGDNVLGQVGATLRAHREIALVRIVVRAPDGELAERRAQGLREWLVQWGVPASRLEARGAAGDEAVEMLVVH